MSQQTVLMLSAAAVEAANRIFGGRQSRGQPLPSQQLRIQRYHDGAHRHQHSANGR
jgi:hypothetical protein